MQNNAEKLFLRFFNEGLEFTGISEHNIKVDFDNYPYYKPPYMTDATGIYPPMIPFYEDGELHVVKRWVEACIDEFKPTHMRNLAYYYAYGFWAYYTNSIKIEPFPINE